MPQMSRRLPQIGKNHQRISARSASSACYQFTLIWPCLLPLDGCATILTKAATREVTAPRAKAPGLQTMPPHSHLAKEIRYSALPEHGQEGSTTEAAMSGLQPAS